MRSEQHDRDLGFLGFLQHSIPAVATTGASRMPSTPCAMKERIALIWFSAALLGIGEL